MKQEIIFLVLILLASCASQSTEKQLAEKAAKSHVTTSKALGAEIDELISRSKKLTEAQKKELLSIMEKNKARAIELSEQTYKIRSVLVEELLSDKPDVKKINLLKNQIRDVEKLRLKNTFETVEKFSSIVIQHENRKEFIDHLTTIDRR